MENKLTNIYKITNLVNNYVYVGSTNKELNIRFKEHCKPSNWNKNPNSLLYKDMKEFGTDNFQIELLDTCFERHRFIIEEYWWEKLYKENNFMYGLKKGNTLTNNTIQRMTTLRNERNSNIYNNENFKNKVSLATLGEKNGMYGKKDENAINGRMVIAYIDKDHNEIFKQFPSVKEALRYLKIKSHSDLNKSCRNNTLYKGYYWSKEWIER